jgi:hypothetical protein
MQHSQGMCRTTGMGPPDRWGVYVGGTEQIVVAKPWLIKGVEVISASPIK